METSFILIPSGNFHNVLQLGDDFTQMRFKPTLRPGPRQVHCILFIRHASSKSISYASLFPGSEGRSPAFEANIRKGLVHFQPYAAIRLAFAARL